MLNLRLDCPMGKVCQGNACQWDECPKQLPNQFNGVSLSYNSYSIYNFYCSLSFWVVLSSLVCADIC